MRVIDSTKNMNVFKATWKYFLDKGAYLLLISVAPSLFIPFLLSPSSTLYYLFEYKTINPQNFGDMYRQMRALPFSYWYLGLIGLALLVFSIAITFGVIDRHMRIGEFTVSPSRVKNRLNYNILTALRFGITAFAAMELSNLLTSVLYYLWWVTFKSGATWLVFSIFTLLLNQLIMLVVMSWLILWSPYCLHTGLKAKDAIVNAVRSMSGRVIRTTFTLFSCVAPIELVMIITGALNAGVIAQFLLDVISYMVVVPFYITLMYTLFYDVTGTERMDYVRKKKDIWSKK